MLHEYTITKWEKRLEEGSSMIEDKRRIADRNGSTEMIIEETELKYFGENGVKIIAEYMNVSRYRDNEKT